MVTENQPKSLPWWHFLTCNWSRWSVPVPGVRTGIIYQQPEPCQVQERRCFACNKIELRAVE